MQHLFVYGSLLPGNANEHILNHIDGDWRVATIRGNWFAEGWGYVNHGLCGLVVDGEGQEISGQIFSSENLKNHWVTLDEFEGSDYERVKAHAVCDNGDLVDVCVYALKRNNLNSATK